MEGEEILNIDYHRVKLLLKALNGYPHRTAAKKLGITARNLYRMRDDYDIDFTIGDSGKRVYFVSQKSWVKILNLNQ